MAVQTMQTMLDGIFRAGKNYKKTGVVSGIVPKEACSTTLSLSAKVAAGCIRIGCGHNIRHGRMILSR
jgi:hypothetical protein